MIALDTSVLVRFLVRDDEAQYQRARELLRRAVDRETPMFVPEVVLCELVWVLARSYRFPRSDQARTLEDLLRTDYLSFRSQDVLLRAWRAFAQGRGDFADYLVREQALDAGCSHVATFDHGLTREAGFSRV